MMTKKDRVRIDYMPGGAAVNALGIAAAMFPNLRNQDLLDKLVITAVSALAYQHWRPPTLWGRDRDAWTLSAGLMPVKEGD